MSVTWGNQPGTQQPVFTTISGTGWVEWNVTEQVLAGAPNGFMIRDQKESDGMGNREQQFHSRENQNKPELVIKLKAASGAGSQSSASTQSMAAPEVELDEPGEAEPTTLEVSEAKAEEPAELDEPLSTLEEELDSEEPVDEQ
jgi:hypothetical protein